MADLHDGEHAPVDSQPGIQFIGTICQQERQGGAPEVDGGDFTSAAAD